jgi:HEAT repeat protein
MRSTSPVKPISPGTIAMVGSLASNPGLLARIVGRTAAPTANVLSEIAETGEIEAAFGLLGVALVGAESARGPVLAVVDQMVRGAPLETLLWLDLRARMLSEWRREWYWASDVTPVRVRALAPSPASAPGLASLHPNGFVREAAVERLTASDDPLAVPFLLIRANDWVGPVRGAAAAGLEAQLTRHGAGHFVPSLPLVDRLLRVERNDLKPLADRILNALASPEAAPALAAGCSAPSRAVRRRCVELALAAKTIDMRALIEAGLRDPDPVVRTRVAKGAGKALAWLDLEPLVGPMLASSTPAVRYSALDILWTQRATGAREVLERHLVDPHAHVRGTARWLLKNVPGFEAAASYRAALARATDGTRVGALEGLAEVGDPGDATLAVPYLDHPRARVRTAAVHAVGALGGEVHREPLIVALSDPSSKVSGAARRVLLRGGAIDPERITWAALRSQLAHERKGAIELARAHDHWVAGLLLLRIASRATDAEVVRRACEALEAWEARYNRVFTAPAASQLAEWEAIVDADSAIEAALLGRLRALLPAMKARARGG